MRFRLFCAECPNRDRYGGWHDTASAAARDARQHADQNPDHYPYI